MEHIFKPLISTQFPANGKEHENEVYFSSVMLEYIHSLIELEIPVNPSIQLLCIDYIIESNQLQRLQSLLQGRTFIDSIEFAERLINAAEVNNEFSQAVQMAIDMYHRLNKYERVIELLLKEKRVEDVIKYVEKLQLKGTKAKEILKVAQELPLKERHLYVEYFSKVIVSL